VLDDFLGKLLIFVPKERARRSRDAIYEPRLAAAPAPITTGHSGWWPACRSDTPRRSCWLFAPLDAGRTGDGDAGTDVFGGRPIKVIWLTVTDIGRQALAARSIRGP
jgi:hypothetical protein